MRWSFDPLKLVLFLAAVAAAVTHHYTTGIILAAATAIFGLKFTWGRY